MPGTHAYGLEKLFYHYGVDLAIWAHEHSYERTYPVYNRTVGTAMTMIVGPYYMAVAILFVRSQLKIFAMSPM